MTKERLAQIGITVEFLIVVRALGEFFRLRHALGTNFSTAVAAPYIGGALIAVCSCWAAVSLYFFRRYTLSAWIALATYPFCWCPSTTECRNYASYLATSVPRPPR